MHLASASRRAVPVTPCSAPVSSHGRAAFRFLGWTLPFQEAWESWTPREEGAEARPQAQGRVCLRSPVVQTVSAGDINPRKIYWLPWPRGPKTGLDPEPQTVSSEICFLHISAPFPLGLHSSLSRWGHRWPLTAPGSSIQPGQQATPEGERGGAEREPAEAPAATRWPGPDRLMVHRWGRVGGHPPEWPRLSREKPGSC